MRTLIPQPTQNQILENIISRTLRDIGSSTNRTPSLAQTFTTKYANIEKWQRAHSLSGEDTVGQAKVKMEGGALMEFIDCNNWQDCVIAFVRKQEKG